MWGVRYGDVGCEIRGHVTELLLAHVAHRGDEVLVGDGGLRLRGVRKAVRALNRQPVHDVARVRLDRRAVAGGVVRREARVDEREVEGAQPLKSEDERAHDDGVGLVRAREIADLRHHRVGVRLRREWREAGR